LRYLGKLRFPKIFKVILLKKHIKLKGILIIDLTILGNVSINLEIKKKSKLNHHKTFEYFYIL